MGFTPNIYSIDMKICFDYALIFKKKIPKEVKANLEKDAQLKNDYKNFMRMCQKGAPELVKELNFLSKI